MGFSNGQIEPPSQTGGKGEKGDQGLSGIGFNLTDDDNFDLDGKRLTEVAIPIDDADAATKKYLQDYVENADVIYRDERNTMTQNLDLDGNRTIHLGDGSSDTDAVNLKQLKSNTDDKKQNYH